ncbi:heavy metal translocating P-type ATPase [Solirhodobacter olei]|uniref:heavy metal translocating P-type ATPase n=1 Tax=Solirhodobacter olei TaxID=2493082 RepID=UPI000FDAABF4|nr:heavy metal translocating P-type ATPase [Solirhodobacter olei]
MSIGDLQKALRPGLIAWGAGGLVLGLVLRWAGTGGAATVWTGATLPVLAMLLVEIVTTLRRGEFGLDLVAALSMTAALVFGETLAAAVVALMYAGGQALEAFAERRARSEMTALLTRVPRKAIRHRGAALEEVDLDAVRPGDRLLIRRGDVLPVDGALASDIAHLDLSALTGEPLPQRFEGGAELMSGATNAGDPFDLLARRVAAESTFAGIVRLVQQAQAVRAPMARLADRYALGFLVLTLALAGAAWGLSGDPVRAVAVLVVATPCPLILAVPVALVAGLSQAAKQGILIKSGRALEALAGISALVLDKTGTLTSGQPGLIEIREAGEVPAEELLRLAAALEQASPHTIAEMLVAEARRRHLDLPKPEAVRETAGEGVEGRIDGRAVLLGGRGFVAAQLGLAAPPKDGAGPGEVTVAVAVDGRWAGELVLADTLREGIEGLFAALRAAGIARIVLATGDRPDVAEAVVDGLGFEAVHAGLAPADKIGVVLAERKAGRVMMVGDGVNDAPALAAADVGVAMGARGAAASAEAADVVLLVDRLDRVLPALAIARRTRRIALQSVVAGIGLSVLGMLAAALGLIVPVEGALLQELIDVAVVLNALRALRG